jgi:hypothetical protein
MSSLILMLAGKSVCNAALGWRFMTTDPREGGGRVGAVRPDTVAALLDKVLDPDVLKPIMPEPPELEVNNPVVTVPGGETLAEVRGGKASLYRAGGNLGLT